MFWERLCKLCEEKGISPSAVARSVGLSNATATKWKKGSEPNAATLGILASFFGVTSDYLLGRTDRRTTSIASDEDIKFALFNGADGVTDKMYEEVKQFAEMVKLREDSKKKN